MRLIDADKLKNANKRILHCDFPNITEDTFEDIIDSAPTIDAVERSEYEKMKDLAEQYKYERDVLEELQRNKVEVVRCENCKWCYDGYCSRFDDLIPFGHEDEEWRDFYCSYGERKEE